MNKVVILVFLFISGLLLSGLFLNQSLWLDEATSVLAAKNFSATEIMTKFSPSDFHPPFHYLLLHFWIKVGDSGEWWSRSLSVVATLTTAFFVWQMGKMFMEKKWAVLAGALYATGPLVFYYSHEARMYALAALLTTTTFWAFFNLIRSRRMRWWFAWVLLLASVVYTDYMPFLVLPVFCLAIFMKGVPMATKKKVALGIVAVAALFLPWTPSFFHQLGLGANVQASSPGWSAILGSFSFKSAPLLWVKLIIGRISFYNKIVYGWVVVLASLVFGLSLLQSLKGSTRKKGLNLVGYLWLWLAVPVILGLLISLRLSIFQYFRFLFIAPAFYLLVALGLRNFRRWSLDSTLEVKQLGTSGFLLVSRAAPLVVLAANIFFILSYITTPRFYREDWRSTAKHIKESLKPPAVALFPNTGQADPYRYYGAPAPVVNPETWKQTRPRQVWLFRYVQEIFDPEDSLRKGLESEGYRKIEEKAFNQVLVWRYELP